MEKRFIKVNNINWDTDNDKKVFDTLPKEFEVEITEKEVENITNISEIEDFISDYITDKTGFTHFGFDVCIYFDTCYGLIHPVSKFAYDEEFYELYDEDGGYYGEFNVPSLDGVTTEMIEEQIYETLNY